MQFQHKIFTAVFGVLFFTLGASAQTHRNQRPAASPMPQAAVEPHKKNSRPDAKSVEIVADYVPTHFFEFDRPGFLTPKVLIEHDEKGRGEISFRREGLEETITDPIQLSPHTVEAINETLAKMSFLDSKVDYQYEKDMPQMGNNTFTLKRSGAERKVKYNWTTHPEAKFLMDEYRRVGNEYVWRFDLVMARDNQPLQTPNLLSQMESYLRRSEISDPPHLLPLLTEISTDERIPLIARNKASRLIKQIEKERRP